MRKICVFEHNMLDRIQFMWRYNMIPFDLVKKQTQKLDTDWFATRKDIPKTKEEWQGYFAAITKNINSKRGTENCVYCAFRVNEYLSNGFKRDQPPVVTRWAKLYTHPTFSVKKLQDTIANKQEEELIRSFCYDKRLLKKCVEYSRDDIIEDISDDDKVIIEIRESDHNKPEKYIKFLKANREDLFEKLKHSPRRAKDGSAYGFVILTWPNDNTMAHIINYFVTPNNELFFLDGQPKRLEKRVTTDIKFMEDYRSEIFYIPAKPPEGFKIKSEPSSNNKSEDPVLIKQEPLEEHPMPMKFSKELCEMLTATLKDEKSLADLLQNRLDDQFDFNIAAICAASGGHKTLTLALLNDERNKTREYNRVAVSAAKVGRIDLALEIFKDAGNENKNYNEAAVFAVQHDCKDLALRLLTDASNTPPDYNGAALVAALKGQMDVALEIFDDKGNANKDYNQIAAKAAQAGSKDFALKLLVHPRNITRDFNRVVIFAFLGSHSDLAWEIFNDSRNCRRHYNLLAATAVEIGCTDFALKLLTHSSNIDPDYNGVVAAAVLSGRFKVAWEIWNDIRNVNKNYNQVAMSAAQVGWEGFALGLLTHGSNTDPDYSGVADCATKNGHQELASEILKLQMLSADNLSEDRFKLKTEAEQRWLIYSQNQQILTWLKRMQPQVPSGFNTANTVDNNTEPENNKRQKRALS